jgi:predicted enzyme related to lactoylglutathione lyase
MYVVKEYPDNLFAWVDVTTTDLAGAKAFYGGLFGWDFDDQETDMGTIYAMCQLDGWNVAGMGPLSPDMQEQGIPPFWSSYVKHSDVDAVARRITANGGTLLFPPMDVMDAGRMLMATDPAGAAFGVWQPKAHIGAQVVNSPNSLVWNELQTRDVEGAKAFYGTVFGWTHQTDANGYVVFQVDGRAQAGMMQIDESWGEVPNNWAVNIMVEDCQASAGKAQELGGTSKVPPTRAGEMGTFAVVQDPQGAILTIMQFDGPVDVPPGAEVV